MNKKLEKKRLSIACIPKFIVSGKQAVRRCYTLKENGKKTVYWAGNLFIPVAVAFLLLSLLRCTPKTQQAVLPLETPATFSGTGETPTLSKWWRVFEDLSLNALVDSAMVSNFDMHTAWQRLLAAQAVNDREASFLVPDLDISVQSGVSFPQPDFVGGENVRLGLNSFYEVDLWGRIKAGVEAEELRTQATMMDYQATALFLSGEVVLTWYQLTEARNQVQLVGEQLKTNEQILQLIRNRFGTGQVRSVDIIRQQQLLEATREQQVVAESRAEVLEHRLAVLSGQVPQNYTVDQPDTLPALPPLPETGIPLDLIQRRPDVQAAFLQLKAADRDLAVALSNRYPRLSLNASISVRSNNVKGLFEEWTYNIAGNLLAPILYGGRLRAEVDRNEAEKEQRLYEYGQAVLTAFQEVEDALVREKKQKERIVALEEQIRLARQTYNQLRVGYYNGTGGYLDVLTALTQEQQLRRRLLAANLDLLDFRIALYRSLAGGFETGRELDNDQ